MSVNIINIEVDPLSVNPALKIMLEIKYFKYIQSIISISGYLSTSDNKIISNLNEIKCTNGNYFELKMVDKDQQNKIRSDRTNRSDHTVFLNAELSPMAIEYIEQLREKREDKSVSFNLTIYIKYLELVADPYNFSKVDSYNTFIKVQIEEEIISKPINQSSWVRDFASQLGIGNFLLLELNIPDVKKVSAFWKELYELLFKNTKEMNKCLKEGDWRKTIYFARRFFEDIKFKDSKPADKKFKEELDKLLINDQHSEDGIKNFHIAIWNFFDFLSKYIHDKDKRNVLNPEPIITKEDAYFAYSLSVGLLNLIGKKLNDE